MWQQLVEVAPLRVGFQQHMSGRGDHDRIHHQVRQPAGGGEFRDRADDVRRGEHAGLHGGDGEVVQHRLDLCDDERRGYRVHTGDAAGVLRGEGGDGTGTEHAERRERLQIGLDAGTAAGVRAGDGHGDGWVHGTAPR
jgi:hypothetical protein